jgi:hypothetical protein
MAYSDSTHFSDKLSYKILCVLSYRLKDTNFARYKYLQEFQKTKQKKKMEGCWSGPEPDWRRIATVARQQRAALGGSGLRPNSGARSEQKVSLGLKFRSHQDSILGSPPVS